MLYSRCCLEKRCTQILYRQMFYIYMMYRKCRCVEMLVFQREKNPCRVIPVRNMYSASLRARGCPRARPPFTPDGRINLGMSVAKKTETYGNV